MFMPQQEDKTDDMKDRFSEKQEHVFDKFPKYHMKILLADPKARVVREDIFKPRIENENLHEMTTQLRIVNFATSKNLLPNVQCSHIVTFINPLGCLLMERHTTKLTIF
jgi:hypothetical protein